jgi:hypothetical protein
MTQMQLIDPQTGTLHQSNQNHQQVSKRHHQIIENWGKLKLKQEQALSQAKPSMDNQQQRAPKTPKGKIPQKVSNRPNLAKTNTTIAEAPKIDKKLALPKQPKKAVPKDSSTVVGKPMTKKFINKFDKPLTEREIAQLKLAQLQGKDQGPDLLKKLLVQSQQLAKQLAPSAVAQATAVEDKKPLQSTLSPRKTATVKSRSEQLSIEIAKANEDLSFLHEQFPKLDSAKQTTALQQFRAKYSPGKKTTSANIAKLIRSYIEERNAELQKLPTK